MLKILISAWLFLFLFVLPTKGSQPSFVSLWKSGNKVIQSILPGGWESLESEQIENLIAVVPQNIIQQSGKLVSGFVFFSESNRENASNYPIILVFVKSGENINQEMIQKTHVWLKKNQNLVTNIVSDKVENVGIQNIEYNQKIPAILFQNRIPVNEYHFTGLSSIIFLKNSVLNIVCLADEKKFAEYETVFQSFIESVVIPKSLRHEAALINKTKTTLGNQIFALVNDKWQLFLGIFIIVVIYGFVFRTTSKEKL